MCDTYRPAPAPNVHEGWSWTHEEKNIIELVEKHPVLYQNMSIKRPIKVDKILKDAAWEQVSIGLKLDVPICVRRWDRIRYIYIKIMLLIKAKMIKQEDVIFLPELSKYLDGKLSFLDPYITKLTDTDVPYYMHKLVDKKFHLVTKPTPNATHKASCTTNLYTHENVKSILATRKIQKDSDNLDMEGLQRIVEKAVEKKFKSLLKSKIPSEIIDCTSSASDNEDINNQVPANSKVHSNVSNNCNVHSNLSDNDNAQSNISDDYIRKFFKELGLVMSLELPIEKQRILKQRINDLIKMEFLGISK